MSTNLSPHVQLHTFPIPPLWRQSLAATVADNLRTALTARGRASSRSPAAIPRNASCRRCPLQSLPLERRRCNPGRRTRVPASHERSNARSLRENLLRGAAVEAGFLPLYRVTPNRTGLAGIERDLAALCPRRSTRWCWDGRMGTPLVRPPGDRLAEALISHDSESCCRCARLALAKRASP